MQQLLCIILFRSDTKIIRLRSAEAPCNGTLDEKTATPLSTRGCQESARVPLSERVFAVRAQSAMSLFQSLTETAKGETELLTD